MSLPSDSLTSLAAVAALSKELASPYLGINQYIEVTTDDAKTLINTINTLIEQPDYSTYATQQEQSYYTSLSVYLTNFINNFPTL